MKHDSEGKTITNVDDAVAFLTSQGFQINPVDGIYRVRKAGWDKRPYELTAERLIEQADLLRGTK